MSRCRTCGAALAQAERFCGSCGAPTRAHARAVAERVRGDRATTRRAALAFALTCCGPLAALLALPGDGWAATLVRGAALLLVAGAAAVVHGRWRESVPLRTSPGWLAAAVPAAVATLAVALVWVGVLRGWASGPAGARTDDGADTAALPLAVIVGTVVVAPLTEELLARGASFRAAATLASPRAAVVPTAVVFAFLHGLGGGYLLELPHRFAMGVVAGWLRWRSGSVLPGIVAHALHNGAAVLLG
jgi:membrane protease YdiL (CAAX protease family)